MSAVVLLLCTSKQRLVLPYNAAGPCGRTFSGLHSELWSWNIFDTSLADLFNLSRPWATLPFCWNDQTYKIDTGGPVSLLRRTPLHRCDVRAAQSCSSLMCRWPVTTVIAALTGLFALPIFRLSYRLLWIVSTTGWRVPASGDIIRLSTCSATRETAELHISTGNWVMKIIV